MAGSDAKASCTIRVIERKTPRIPGDISGDGKVNLLDLVRLRRAIVNGWSDTLDWQNGDVNGDLVVDLKDVTILSRYLAGGWGVELQ